MTTKYQQLIGLKADQILSRQQAYRFLKGSPGCHVYILWATYADDLVPIYVGKGTGYRSMAHVCPSSRGTNQMKIEAIDLSEAPIVYSFHVTGSSHPEAYTEEARLIAMIGLKKEGRGPLTNLGNGGVRNDGLSMRKGGDNPRAKPCYIDGQLFPSMQDATKSTGIKRGTLSMRIKLGWPGYYYEADGQRPCRKGLRGSATHRPVVACGKTYPSLTHAARDMNVAPVTIFRRVAAGWPGYRYLDGPGADRPERPRVGYEDRPEGRGLWTCSPKPVSIEGNTFGSVMEAARAYSVSQGAVQYWLKQGLKSAHFMTRTETQ